MMFCSRTRAYSGSTWPSGPWRRSGKQSSMIAAIAAIPTSATSMRRIAWLVGSHLESNGPDASVVAVACASALRPAPASAQVDDAPEAGNQREQKDVDDRQAIALDGEQVARAALDHERDGEDRRGGQKIGAVGPGQARRAGQPEQSQSGEADGDEGHRLGADPDAERGDGAGEQRRAPILRRRGQTRGEPDQDHRQQQEQAVMVGPTDAGIGEHARLGEQGQAGEQAGVAIERRGRGPADGDHPEREQGGADQDAPDVQRPLEAQERLQQPCPGEQQRIQRSRPMLDVAFGRVDARLAGIEPGAAVMQLQQPGEAHVGVGIGERAVEDRHESGEREDRLAEREAADRDQEQPAERRPVGRGVSGDGRVRRHRSSCRGREARAAWPPPG